MTAIGFCGGSHCGPEHGDRLLARGAALIIADMRELGPIVPQSNSVLLAEEIGMLDTTGEVLAS